MNALHLNHEKCVVTAIAYNSPFIEHHYAPIQ